MRPYRKTATIISIFSCFFSILTTGCSSDGENSMSNDSKVYPNKQANTNLSRKFSAKVNYSISDEYLFFSYEGPEFAVVNGEISDTAHRLSNFASKITGEQLKKRYAEGNYSKVDLRKIVMKTEGMDNEDSVLYTLKIPLVRVKNKCAAFTSFDHSGGWNHAPDIKKRLKDLKKPGKTTVLCNSLRVSKCYKTKENLQEYWIQWKNKQMQGECPCK